MLAGIALSSAIALVGLASRADAHGALYQPEPTFMDGKSDNEWVANIDNYWPEVGDGGDQSGIFQTMAEEKGMTVRDVALEMAPEYPCGYTTTDVEAQPVPTDGKAIWRGSNGGGFTHRGPCEIWIDDTMVLHGDDCEEEYPGGADGSDIMSEMPVDYSSCNGDCTFAIYWLGFQNEQWQAYINCVPLTGGSTTASDESTTEEWTSEAPETETEAPATEAPEAGLESESESSESVSSRCSASHRLRK